MGRLLHELAETFPVLRHLSLIYHMGSIFVNQNILKSCLLKNLMLLRSRVKQRDPKYSYCCRLLDQ